jgi:hypothetical protein
MAKREPILELRLSNPKSFHCSFCRVHGLEGMFVATGEGTVSDLVAAFEDHVQQFHTAGEDFSQAAARIVREATEGR